jgi:hypothetical protein
MGFDAHERARFLIDESRVAGISAEKTAWLRGHVAECAECARHEENTARMLGALGEFSFGRAETKAWGKPPERRLQPRLAAPLWIVAAAGVMLIAAVPVYRSMRERADARLLERVGDHVSRTVPQALEPLMNTGDGQ